MKERASPAKMSQWQSMFLYIKRFAHTQTHWMRSLSRGHSHVVGHFLSHILSIVDRKARHVVAPRSRDPCLAYVILPWRHPFVTSSFREVVDELVIRGVHGTVEVPATIDWGGWTARRVYQGLWCPSRPSWAGARACPSSPNRTEASPCWNETRECRSDSQTHLPVTRRTTITLKFRQVHRTHIYIVLHLL